MNGNDLNNEIKKKDLIKKLGENKCGCVLSDKDRTIFKKIIEQLYDTTYKK